MIILDSDVLSIVQRRAGDEYLRLIARLDALPFPPVAVTIMRFEEQARLVKLKIRVGMDLRIASVALAHGATLFTRNVVDFSKIPGLIVEDPVIG